MSKQGHILWLHCYSWRHQARPIHDEAYNGDDFSNTDKSKYQMLVRNDKFPYITHPKSVQHYSSTSSLLKSDVIFPRNCTNESEGNPLMRLEAGASQSGLRACLLQRASPIHMPPDVYHHHQSAIMKKNYQLLCLPAISSINKSSGFTLRYKRPQTFSQ